MFGLGLIVGLIIGACLMIVWALMDYSRDVDR
jgi:hypothetical protein